MQKHHKHLLDIGVEVVVYLLKIDENCTIRSQNRMVWFKTKWLSVSDFIVL